MARASRGTHARRSRVRSRVRGRAARVPVRYLGQGAAVSVFGVSAAFGGLDAAEPPLATPAVGERYAAEQLAVTVDRVVLVDDLAPSIRPADGRRLLVVVAEVENLRTGPALAVADTVVPDGVATMTDDTDPMTMLVRDGSLMPTLQPGLVERTAFAWEVPVDAPVPAEIDVIVHAKSLDVSSELTVAGNWVDPQPAARVTVAVEDLTEAGHE